MPEPADPKRKVLVWDLPTRLFHWLLVLGVLCAWLTAEVFPQVDLGQHKLVGYLLLGLLLFRLVWGFVGGRHSRFGSFVPGPAAVWRYTRGLLRRDAPPHGGHNPLGALSVLALLASLLVQVVSGLMNDDEILAAGPLAPLVSPELRELAGQVHAVNFNVLLALIALHVAAILYYLVWRRQNLVRPMLGGHAELPEAEAGSSPPAWIALVALVVAGGAVAAVVWGLPAWLPNAPGGSGFD